MDVTNGPTSVQRKNSSPSSFDKDGHNLMSSSGVLINHTIGQSGLVNFMRCLLADALATQQHSKVAHVHETMRIIQLFDTRG
jgi:hypothetical protein